MTLPRIVLISTVMVLLLTMTVLTLVKSWVGKY